MIYIIISFGIVIILSLSFIIWALRKYMEIKHEFDKSQFMKLPIPIIERAYRAVDLRYSINYIDPNYAMRNYFDPIQTIVHDDEHKKYLIEKACHKLTQEMLSGGFIELKDTKNDPNYYGNPYQNSIELRVKVYKPEN